MGASRLALERPFSAAMVSTGRHPVEIDHLRCLVAVVDEGGFTRAAERLHRSTSAVSRAVKDLERSLGAELLERGGQGVCATPAGVAVVATARDVLSTVDRLRGLVRDQAANAPARVRIGASSVLPPAVLDVMGSEVRAAAGSDDGSLVVDSSARLTAAVDHGDLDAAVVLLPSLVERLVQRPVGYAPLWLVVSSEHRLAGRTEIDAHDLAGERVALPPRENHPAFVDDMAARLAAVGAVVTYEDKESYVTAHRVRFGELVTFTMAPRLRGAFTLYATEDYVVLPMRQEIVPVVLGLVWRPAFPAEAVVEDLAERLAKALDSLIGLAAAH